MVKAAGQLAQRRRNAPESDRGERQWRATAARSSTRGPMSMVAMRMCLSSMKIQRGKMEGERCRTDTAAAPARRATATARAASRHSLAVNGVPPPAPSAAGSGMEGGQPVPHESLSIY